MKNIPAVLCLLLMVVRVHAADTSVVLTDFKLTGDLSDGAAFTLTATAHVNNSAGASLPLLTGPVALTSFEPTPRTHIHAGQNQFFITFDHRGDFPIQIKFSAKVHQQDDWSEVEFAVAPSVLEPLVLLGLPIDTQFQFAGAARPERKGSDFLSYLPADGMVKFSWKKAQPESEGKLFYSAEMLSQVSVSPGLMQQVALLNFKVMQGELSQVSLRLHGVGEVTRVQGDKVLAWTIATITNSRDRRLIIQLNQPQKDQFAFQVQAQTPLDAFPQTTDILQLAPENATRFAGYLRLENEGAVRLEVLQSHGASQISPEQFPNTDATRTAFRDLGGQTFVYRFAGTDFALRVQADQVLPEVAASEMLAYRVAENELTVDAELELDIREAPLRELALEIPKGFAVAHLEAAGLSDYFLTEPAGKSNAELRLVYGQPVSERQLVRLRLEHNQVTAGTNWTLPRLSVAQAKSVRGFVAVAAEAGFRLTPEKTKALTEIATAFYPGKIDGLQTAFRVNDNDWEATVNVQRLPQTIQASALHLFSIGEGVAYGSSLINYVVSGAPVGTFRIALSNEYYNVEFTGKDLRNWQKTNDGYIVQLQTPVAGPYTLLATYERPFKAQGETLAFTGARPLDVQSEDGYTLITSANQLEVKPVDVSTTLLPLEPGEVPPEYRLFFDAPILAAYRYASRPFNLNLLLRPLAQEDSVNQIVDRASFHTRISKEGQVLTDVSYFLKNRGNSHFRVTLPEGAQMWSASVNGAATVPVQDGKASLIPLPQSSDPNAVLELDLKLASQSSAAKEIHLATPVADAPVMLARWEIEPDTGQHLIYKSGSIIPIAGAPDLSGFAQIIRLFESDKLSATLTWLLAAIVLAASAVLVWRRASRDGVYRTGAAGVLILFALIVVCFVQLAEIAGTVTAPAPATITFLAPVQQAGTALDLVVSNVGEKTTFRMMLDYGWPALATVVLWLTGYYRFPRASRLGGWLLLTWGALRLPNSGALVFWILFVFLAWQIAVPVLKKLWRLPRSMGLASAPATAALIIGGLLWLNSDAVAASATIPDSVTQTIRVENKFAVASAKIRWQASKGETLALLSEPAVLTHVSYPVRSLELVAGPSLIARSSGVFEIEVQYQVPVTESHLALPVPFGIINQLNLTMVDLDVDVLSPQAVSIHSNHVNSNTLASLVLSPATASISWQPRRRDVKHEKPVFYADISQLYVPMAGVIETVHDVSIRPAQGELSELTLNAPAHATVTDVNGPAVSLWRFDPGSRKLRVTLNPPQSRPFVIIVRAQISAGPLPFEQAAGLVTVDNAAGQIGLAGVATGSEVQLDSVAPHGLSPINLEDFPTAVASVLQGQMPDLTLRRAFRYSDTNATLALRAAAVEPDVRVETDDTLSLGEDRTVLADNFAVDITRAGIFDLSFLMPSGFDVESISSPALSQWTEMKTAAGRLITLHLTTKTLGHQSFALTVTGPGIKTALNWKVPQIILREATKQEGALIIVPEQGMRLQVATREGYTQLDPQKSGIRQKGVLGFRALQVPATLALDIEQVDPWIQVTSLQHAAISEAQVKVTANFQYQIENTGLKQLKVLIPTNAQNVHFQGAEMEDFIPSPEVNTNGLQLWQVKLRRRFIGQYLLQIGYQIPLPNNATRTILRSVEAAEVNLQRGFLTLESDPRLGLTVASQPQALQPSEWQSIPVALEKDLGKVTANLTYRLVEPSFQLPLTLERHEATKVLPARVNSITFHSVIADDGVMLTSTILEILPGDKRLLAVDLPPESRFWFAFVNHTAVWPRRDGDKILIPLERQVADGKPVEVEIFHSGRAGRAGSRALDLVLLAPKFDLPLENITWNLSLSDKWRVKHWAGSLQLQRQEIVPSAETADAQTYLNSEHNLQQARTAEAEELLALGNTSLAAGEPQQARRAFEAAYDHSTQDAAFNEDARVELHNIKLQQALIGLDARQSATAGDTGVLGGKLRDLRTRRDMNYTQQDAKDIIDINDAEDNAAFLRLAEKLIQQQDAAVSNPAGFRAIIPEQGRLLTFTRDVAVQPWADLNISLQTSVTGSDSSRARPLILVVALMIFFSFGTGTAGCWGFEPSRRHTC